MLNILERATDSAFWSAVVLNWQRDKSLAGPYRKIRTLMDPERDIREYEPRGMIFADTDNNYFFVDATILWQADPAKPSPYYIRELGIKKMSGLPSEGKRGRVNPNEWEETKALFIGDAPEDVKNDLRALLDHPDEWPRQWHAFAPPPPRPQ
ncbi:MAG: hypothetical protein AB7S81_03835 [Bdellovibrionales bacterium]